MTDPGKIEFREVPGPGPVKAGEVKLRIRRIGICGSDVHVYHGTHPFTSYPVVQGHEYSGIVESTGEKVTKVKPGMKATARPQLVCGTCGPCRQGRYNVCENLKVQGFQASGCARDLFVVSEDRVVALPAGMSFEQGAMIEPAAVGAHSTGRVPGGLQGKNVVVAGAGTIGNLVAQFVLARGASGVLITDISDFRLGIARRCGIRETANVGKESLEDAVKRVFGKDGFQAGFEAAGSEAALGGLIEQVEKGSTVVVAGVFGEFPKVNMPFVVEHELQLTGTMMYRHEDYEVAAEMISSGKISTDPLITAHFPFGKYPEAYRFIEEKKDKSLKVMIDL